MNPTDDSSKPFSLRGEKRKKLSFVLFIVILFLTFVFFPQSIACSEFKGAGSPNLAQNSNQRGGTFLLALNQPVLKLRTFRVIITAYTSRPEETDNTPFITASGKRVRMGIVASNFLPIGTKIKIPELFGDKIFYVEDRMNPLYKDRIDVWMPSLREAKRFGKKKTKILVL